MKNLLIVLALAMMISCNKEEKRDTSTAVIFISMGKLNGVTNYNTNAVNEIKMIHVYNHTNCKIEIVSHASYHYADSARYAIHGNVITIWHNDKITNTKYSWDYTFRFGKGGESVNKKYTDMDGVWFKGMSVVGEENEWLIEHFLCKRD